MRYKVCVNFVSFRYDWRLLLHPHYRDFLARDAALAAYLPHGVSSYADKLFSVFRCTYHGIGLGAVLWGSGLFVPSKEMLTADFKDKRNCFNTSEGSIIPLLFPI